MERYANRCFLSFLALLFFFFYFVNTNSIIILNDGFAMLNLYDLDDASCCIFPRMSSEFIFARGTQVSLPNSERKKKKVQKIQLRSAPLVM